MPTYEYLCPAGHHRFYLRQSFTAEPVATCPKCQNTAQRQFQSVAVIYKGSGFYTTDYKRSGLSLSQERDGHEERAGEKEPAAAKKESTESTTQGE